MIFNAKRHSTDPEMIEFHTQLSGRSILAFVVHEDCITDPLLLEALDGDVEYLFELTTRFPEKGVEQE